MNNTPRLSALLARSIITVVAAAMLFTLSGCALFSGTSTADDGDLPPEADTIASKPPVDWQTLDSDATDATPPETPDQPHSLWHVLRTNFELPNAHNKRMTVKLNWYARHPKYIKRVAQRAKPYLYYITTQLQANDMPVDLAFLPIVESAFDPFAYSRSGASGLWQFMPATGRHYGLNQGWWYDGRRDVTASTQAAIRYLKRLHNRFGSWLLALAAYNSGGGRVSWAVRKNKRLGKPTDFWHLDLPRQTRAYVPWLLAVRDIIKDPEKYNIELPPIPNKPYITTVSIDSQIAVARAAKMAGLTVEQMYLLNPGYNQWATVPGSSQTLVIPLSQRANFIAHLAALPTSKRVEWAHHKVRSGQTLSTIAEHYGTTVAVLKRVNHLGSTMIRAGHYLMVPDTASGLNKKALQKIRSMRHVELARQGKKVHYSVRSGDSLWLIARRYGVSIKKLARWNHISQRATLRVGQRLVLWQRHAPSRTHKVNYVVRRGDSLWNIGQRYGVRMVELAQWNSISKNDTLSIGEKLTIWPHGHSGGTTANHSVSDQKIQYTVRSGDSLWSISNQFDVDMKQLASWNELSLDDYLTPGQQLVLYVNKATASTQS